MNPSAESQISIAALTEVARSGLAQAPVDLIKLIAIDIWYGTHVRDLSLLRGSHHKEMLFLVERLTYYNVVPQERKRALLASVRLAGGTFWDLQNPVLEAIFNGFLPELQPMQTRHFQRPLSGREFSKLS